MSASNGQANQHSGRRTSTKNIGRRQKSQLIQQASSKDKKKAEKERRRSLLKAKNKNKGDSKAILTLGVIMGCFTICWLPFFIVQLMQPILTVTNMKDVINVPFWLFEIFLWLGYANSTLNPVIYAKFNKEFRRPFKEILLCHCANINSRLRCASFTQEYALPKKRRHHIPITQPITQTLTS
jgi:5-hydroxytryptamine receptor 7